MLCFNHSTPDWNLKKVSFLYAIICSSAPTSLDNWLAFPGFWRRRKDKNLLGCLPAKFYQTNRQVRNWGRKSGAKSLEVAMCCRSGQEGEQSEGNPADTRQSKKRLTRMLIGSKNCCKYPTSIQIIPSKAFSPRAQHFLAYSYATGALYVFMRHCWSTGGQWWQYFAFSLSRLKRLWIATSILHMC